MRRRTVAITVFVIVWNVFFLYQTFRLNHLGPLLNRELPRIQLLFPPAGWIMFYNVDAVSGTAEVYALRGRDVELIDPHDILETRALGYDNIHRNVLIGMIYRQRAPAFCAFLERKFPDVPRFAVVYAQYPDLVNTPDRVDRAVAYECPLP